MLLSETLTREGTPKGRLGYSQRASVVHKGDMRPSPRVRVAYCLDSFAIGGTELNAVRTAEALDPDRIELFVLHLQAEGPLRSRYERLGVRMAHCPITNLYSPRTAVQGMRLARLLRRHNVDVVHAHDIYTNIFAVPWARALSRCSVMASRRWWYDAPRPGLVTLNRLSYLLAHLVLANSTGVAGLLAREEGVSPHRIVEIPNFLAENAFTAVDDAQRFVDTMGQSDRSFEGWLSGAAQMLSRRAV